MVDYTCPNCNQHYSYAAEIIQAGGQTVRDGFDLVFICPCQERITELELWQTKRQGWRVVGACNGKRAVV